MFNNKPWEQDWIDMAIKLWFEDMSASIVALELSRRFQHRFTKNGVLGMLNRLAAKGVIGRRADYKPKKFVARKKRTPSIVKLPEPVTPEPVVITPVEEAPVIQQEFTFDNVVQFKKRRSEILDSTARNVPIEQTTGCLYATSETSDGIHLFCNDVKKPKSAYCQHHHSICCTPVPMRDPKEKFKLFKR